MPPASAVLRLRLDLAYDGSAFAGWARQPGLRTVQGVLEDAFAPLLRSVPPAPRLVVAGRTDAGVHALGQVAHLDLQPAQRTALEAAAGGQSLAAHLLHRVRGVLGASGSDVVVLGARPAPAGFDARFSALWRRYEYRIADELSLLDPLQRARTVWLPGLRLDERAMGEAAATLLGLHDFASFCRPREGATTIRTLQEFSWRRDADGVLVASVQADAFCHSMVRALVGATVAVGRGRLAVGEPAALREERSRTSRFPVLPAHGLCLLEVGYPPEGELAARAEQTRARRELHEQAQRPERGRGQALS